MKSYLKEIGLFLKKYLASIIIGTIAITVLFGGLIMYQNKKTIEENAGAENTQTPVEMTERTPTFFRFYMKLPDGYSFQNQTLMDEILNSPVVYEQLNDGVSFDITEYFKMPAEDEDTIAEERFRMIDVTANPNSSVFTLVVELGDQERNEEVISFYYNALVNEEIEVLEANEIFILNEPGYLGDSQLDPDLYDDISDIYVQPSLIDAWDIIIAVTFALFMMLLVSVLREVFNKTLNYSFAYHSGDSYDSLLFDKKAHNPELVRYFVASPKHMNKVLLAENPLDSEMTELLEEGNEITFNKNNSNQIFVKNLKTLSDFNLTDNIQEVVIFIHSHQTTRKWYKDEIELSRVLKLPVKTIHFMTSNDK